MNDLFEKIIEHQQELKGVFDSTTYSKEYMQGIYFAMLCVAESLNVSEEMIDSFSDKFNENYKNSIHKGTGEIWAQK